MVGLERDDTILFCDDADQLKYLRCFLLFLEAVPCLEVNLGKSEIVSIGEIG